VSLFDRINKQVNGKPIEMDTMMEIKSKTQNVKDLILAQNLKGAKDNSPLWKNFDDTKLERPMMDGLHNEHAWKPIMGVTAHTKFKLASPGTQIKLPPLPRIIADDLPATTMTKTAMDIPIRKNVLQIDVPISKTKTIEHTIDPKTQLKPDLKSVKHGLEPAHKKFIQVSEHPVSEEKPLHPKSQPEKHHEHHPKNKTPNHVTEALEVTQNVEKRAKALTESIEKKGGPEMLIKMAMTNKQETPDLRQHTPPAPAPKH
jgi:hypothetical protein